MQIENPKPKRPSKTGFAPPVELFRSRTSFGPQSQISNLKSKIRPGAGFTLIELLIAIILMLILMGSVMVIFFTSSETVANGTDRMNIYQNARQTIEQLTRDLQSSISFNRSNQKFVMCNGVINVATGVISADTATTTVTGGHYPTATQSSADSITFRAVTEVNANEFQTVEITYELLQETVGELKTVRTNRPIFVLKRKVMKEGATPGVFDTTVSDKEWCHYVVSFNLEYYANNLTYSQLDPSPFSPADPLGDGDVGGSPKKNDTTEPLRIMGVRITLILVPNERERQERVFVNEIHIPVG